MSRLAAVVVLLALVAGCVGGSPDEVTIAESADSSTGPASDDVNPPAGATAPIESGVQNCTSESFNDRAQLSYDWPFPGNGNANLSFELRPGVSHVRLFFNHTSPTVLFVMHNDGEAEYNVSVRAPGGGLAFTRAMVIEGSADVPPGLEWEGEHEVAYKEAREWTLMLRGRGMAHLSFEAVGTGFSCSTSSQDQTKTTVLHDPFG